MNETLNIHLDSVHREPAWRLSEAQREACRRLNVDPERAEELQRRIYDERERERKRLAKAWERTMTGAPFICGGLGEGD